MMEALTRFLAELRRRKVYHAAGAYAAAAFVVWQVADIAFPAVGLSDRAVGVVLLLTVLGFPLVLVLAWAYELRPEHPPGRSPSEPEVGTVGGPALPHPAEGSRSAAIREDAGPGAFRPTHDDSVAILPFESMSPQHDEEYFADGITEEITNVLAGLSDLHVAARTSAFAFKGRKADIREIGRKLNVAYLVEGSVRRAGETLRITAQLVDTETGFHLWSERFDRPLGDVFAIQDEIAAAVARRLSHHVRRSGASPRPVVRSTEMEAYEAYLRGRRLMADFAGDTVMEAQARFEECIAIDPTFAAGHAGLAEALTLQSIGFQVRPDRETMPHARREADRALELDPDLPEAHLARALVAMYHDWDHPTARAEFESAQRLGPNVARVHMWREFYFTYVEHDYRAALEANRRAQALSPLDLAPRSREGTVHYLFGNLAEAERLFRGMLDEQPRASILHTGLADTLVRQGRVDEGVAAMERALELGGPLVAWLGMLAGFYGLQGKRERGREILRELEERSAQGYVSSFWIAVARAGQGDLDGAFAALGEATRDRDSNLLYAFVTPRALGLRADPRFPGVLRAIGLSNLIPLL